MKKLILIPLLLFSLNLSAKQTQDVDIKVNGMVCSFCAQGIEKGLKKTGHVEKVNVDMDKKIVHVKFKKGQSLDEKRLTQIILDAGMNVEKINRKPASD